MYTVRQTCNDERACEYQDFFSTGHWTKVAFIWCTLWKQPLIKAGVAHGTLNIDLHTIFCMPPWLQCAKYVIDRIAGVGQRIRYAKYLKSREQVKYFAMRST